MPRKRSPTSTASIDDLRDALQIQPVRKAVEKVDRRSLARGRSILKGLEPFKASQVARQLQVSTQKYVAVRRAIQEGKASSSTLNAMLDRVQNELQVTPRLVREKFVAEMPDQKGSRVHKADFWEVEESWMRSNARGAVVEKRFANKQDALNWMGGVVGDSAREFFVLSPTTRGGWNIWDIRTQAEREDHAGAKAVQRMYDDADEED